MIDTNELRRLAQAATSGGWYVERGRYVYGCKDVTDGEEEWHPVIACTDDDETNVNFEGNAAFIAAANPATTLELLDRLEAAEKERESWKGLAKQFGNELDTMRARIEEMEKQEPARLVTAVAYRWRYRGAIKWQYGELTEEGARLAKEHGHEVQPLGILPGAQAQPAPSVPDGVAEALQRLIENGAVLGPASSEDALLVARYRQRLLACVPSVPNDVMAALDNLDDYVARIEGNDRGACAHINLLRQYLLDATEVGENK